MINVEDLFDLLNHITLENADEIKDDNPNNVSVKCRHA